MATAQYLSYTSGASQLPIYMTASTQLNQFASLVYVPQDMTVTSISVYWAGYGGTAAGYHAIWDAGNGAILAQSGTVSATAEASSNTAGSWYTASIGSTVLTGGRNYFVGVWCNQSMGRFEPEWTNGAVNTLLYAKTTASITAMTGTSTRTNGVLACYLTGTIADPPTGGVPSTPNISYVSESGNSVTLRANISSNTTGVTWSPSYSGSIGVSTSGTTSDYTFTVPSSGTQYSWTVTANNSYGTSGSSSTYYWTSPSGGANTGSWGTALPTPSATTGTIEARKVYNTSAPYGNSISETYAITKTGATRIRVRFQDINIEGNDYDHVRTDADVADNWSVNQNYRDVWSGWKTGSTITVTLTSDGSGVGNGFITDYIEYETSSAPVLAKPPATTGTIQAYALKNTTKPYNNNTNETYTVTKTGATRIRVRFSQIDTETGFDYVKTDADVADTFQGLITGGQWSGWKTGATMTITLTSDGSVQKDGFYVDYIEYEQTVVPATPTSAPVFDTAYGTGGKEDNGFYLKINALTGATSYEVEVWDDARTTKVVNSQIVTSLGGIRFTGVGYGQVRRVRYRGLNGSSTGQYSTYNPALTLPSAVAVTGSSVTVKSGGTTTYTARMVPDRPQPSTASVSIDMYASNKTTYLDNKESTASYIDFPNLSSGITYQFRAKSKYTTTVDGSSYSVESAWSSWSSVTIGVRPPDWKWTSSADANGNKLSGGTFHLDWFEWKAFQDKINDFKGYLGISPIDGHTLIPYAFKDSHVSNTGAFENPVSGNNFMYYQYNQAISAINEMVNTNMSFVSSGDVINAWHFNNLKNYLNGL